MKTLKLTAIALAVAAAAPSVMAETLVNDASQLSMLNHGALAVKLAKMNNEAAVNSADLYHKQVTLVPYQDGSIGVKDSSQPTTVNWTEEVDHGLLPYQTGSVGVKDGSQPTTVVWNEEVPHGLQPKADVNVTPIDQMPTTVVSEIEVAPIAIPNAKPSKAPILHPEMTATNQTPKMLPVLKPEVHEVPLDLAPSQIKVVAPNVGSVPTLHETPAVHEVPVGQVPEKMAVPPKKPIGDTPAIRPAQQTPNLIPNKAEVVTPVVPVTDATPALGNVAKPAVHEAPLVLSPGKAEAPTKLGNGETPSPMTKTDKLAKANEDHIVKVANEFHEGIDEAKQSAKSAHSKADSNKSNLDMQGRVIKANANVAEENHHMSVENAKQIGAVRHDVDTLINSNRFSAAASANTSAIQDNSARIATVSHKAAQGINANREMINANRADINKNTAAIKDLRADLEEQGKRINGVGAMAMATSNLVMPYSVGKFSATAGVGNYNGESAVAVGTGYRYNEHLTVRASAAYETGTENVGVGAGVGFEW
ncbi:TPA: YadA C-terminal domain-containing protein [Vibrio harveyi]